MGNLPTVIAAAVAAVALAGVARVARADGHAPTVTVVDRSNDGLDAAERAAHGRAIEHAVIAWAATAADDAGARIDVSVTNVTVAPHADTVAIAAQVRIAICDDHGQLRSVLAGAAKVEIAARHVHGYGLASLREEALVAAAEGVLHKVHATAIARR